MTFFSNNDKIHEPLFGLKKSMRILLFLLTSLFSTFVFAKDLPLNTLHMPPGFQMSIYAEVPNARSMALGDKGTVFVGSRHAGKVYAIVPDTHSPQGTRVITIASGLHEPNGIAFYKGSLYVAEVSTILRFDDIESHLSRPSRPVLITNSLPSDEKDHYWRYIAFGPDHKLYIGIGMPCNVCVPEDPRFGTISRINPDGTKFEIFAKGIRNTVGFDWNPKTHKLWFTDNGRDLLGDNIPPDKLNYAPRKGLDFGFPYYNGKNLPDPVYGKLYPATKFTPPTYELPAHVAPLGMVFYTGKEFPTEYHDQIFFAEHGSWNRSSRIGYQIMTAKISGDKVLEVKPFITGWLQDQKVWGRPVDLLVMPDGSILISDDYADVVYRVTYTG